MRDRVPVVALIEIRAENVSRVRTRLEHEKYIVAFYELVGRFNIGLIVEMKTRQSLFEIVTEIREIPGVEETKTHLIQNGVVL
jgi:DNA-binding Lrp family transcriptional regulator